MSNETSPAGGSQAKDPVCGMTVDPKSAAGQYQYGNKTYYFCCAHCLKKFQADPGKYASA
ncbi:MAG TPA: YHS domain-containing protein [Candidatus Dormibacteraeota bacterium]|nr:YHS domain-containing protein [Candidatus Dormibacteraeota bacterium]